MVLLLYVFNTTFNNIRYPIYHGSVLLDEEIVIPRENLHVYKFYHNVSNTHHHNRESNRQLLVVICTDFIGRCEFYYHKIMAHVGPLYKIYSDFFHK